MPCEGSPPLPSPLPSMVESHHTNLILNHTPVGPRTPLPPAPVAEVRVSAAATARGGFRPAAAAVQGAPRALPVACCWPADSSGFGLHRASGRGWGQARRVVHRVISHLRGEARGRVRVRRHAAVCLAPFRGRSGWRAAVS